MMISTASTVVTPAYVFHAALDTALATIRRTIPHMGTDRPEIGTADLRYQRTRGDPWTSSFWSGQLWLAYQTTGDPFFRDAARAQLPYFVGYLARTHKHDHDLGFLYSLSAVAAYKRTEDPLTRAMGIAAAEALAGRFNTAGQFIQAWNVWSGYDCTHSSIRACAFSQEML